MDTAIAQLSRTIETWAHQVEAFHEWIDTMPDADLEKPPFNYEPIAVAVLKSATHDLWDLSEVYHGNLAVDTPRDFGIFSRRTAGLNLPGLLGLPPL